MIYLIDASVYVFRAYYSMPDDMLDKTGAPVNAVYGFGRFLIDLLRSTKAGHVAVAFDESLTSSYRNEIYPEYKANRDPAPEDLLMQFGHSRALAQALGLVTLSSNRYEADDIIGTLATQGRAAGHEITIVTRDKDLAQLLQPGDVYWDYAADKRFGFDDIGEQFGAAADRFADFLALMGDSVDNIPGVPGIGKKTASVIMAHYPDLESVYDALEDLHALPIRGAKTLGAKLAANRDAAFLARKLTRVECGVPLEVGVTDLKRKPVDEAQIDALFDQLNFGPLLRRQALQLEAGA
ncbi:MAG: exodeoxyribonuclease IX [Xanthomonadales bacterium]|nr:exodeoxyribonuclease IX [Xanthomonadales bacterium]